MPSKRCCLEHLNPMTHRTIPIVPRAPAERSNADSRKLYADYVAASPDWREGRGLFFMFPLDAAQLARVILHAGERLLRQRRGGD